MSHVPKEKTHEQHLAMFEYLKAKLQKDLLDGRYTISFKKDEMEGMITACIIAGRIL